MSTAADLPTPTLGFRQEDAPVLEVPLGASFEEVRELLLADLELFRERLVGSTVRLDLGEGPLRLFDLRRLTTLLREQLGVEVTGLYAQPEAVARFAERELKLKLFPPREPEAEEIPEEAGLEPTAPEDAVPPEADAPEADAHEDVVEDEAELVEADVRPADPPAAQDEGLSEDRPTHYVHRTLRSGASVRHDGDVVVLGDVNPGAEVLARGNVFVLGALKGIAHAGAEGDEACFVMALDLRPTQVRIGRKIAIPPARPASSHLAPEVAHVEGDHVVIEPYPSRSLR